MSSGPSTPDSREVGSTIPEGFAVTRTGTIPTATSTTRTTPKVKPKVSRKDRAKRLLLGLATKHHFHSSVSRGGGSSTPGEIDAAATSPSSKRFPSGSKALPGGEQATPSPLITATDAATVRPGMVLASVAARGGQGVSEEAVDTLGMGVKEAVETLVRWVILPASSGRYSAMWYRTAVWFEFD